MVGATLQISSSFVPSPLSSHGTLSSARIKISGVCPPEAGDAAQFEASDPELSEGSRGPAWPTLSTSVALHTTHVTQLEMHVLRGAVCRASLASPPPDKYERCAQLLRGKSLPIAVP